MRFVSLILLLAFTLGLPGCRCGRAPKRRELGFQPRSSADSSCPQFGAGQTVGRVESAALVEASGLVASRKQQGVLWLHNDSGNQANLLAMNRSGQDLGQFKLDGCDCIDWEDLALGPGPVPGRDYLYVSDSGTNTHARSDIVIYRVPEPQVEPGGQDPQPVRGVAGLSFSYPNQRVFDVEAVFVDPLDGALYQITKSPTGRSLVLRANAPFSTTRTNALKVVARPIFPHTGKRGSEQVTAADISSDGRWLLVKTYTEIYLWPRSATGTVAGVFDEPPCSVPSRKEQQGEAIAFLDKPYSEADLAARLRKALAGEK